MSSHVVDAATSAAQGYEDQCLDMEALAGQQWKKHMLMVFHYISFAIYLYRI